MSKKQDRIQMCSDIIKAANLYKQNLVGKTFMYVFDNRYIQVFFKTKNFKHLTGVDSNLSAKDFYKDAISGRLRHNDIFFSSKHPYSTAEKKLKHLHDFPKLAMNECFLLEDIKTNTQTYKFGATDLNISMLFGNDSPSGGLNNNCLVVDSFRVEDCFSKSNDVYTVSHIFSKSNSDKKYTDLLFMDKQATLEQLPSEIKKLLSDDFPSGFNIEDIKSPVAALTAGATSALASDSANSSTNVKKFSFEPQRGQQLFDISRPVYAGQAAETIAPLPPFDISKVITALEALNEKITNAIHSFTDSFSLSHSPKQSAQEQPPQAHTAHERKTNSELPFPKQKLTNERTEPVTAKREKARKPEVKSAEKRSNWIGNLINSAKTESDKHNESREPKAHDKDKSL